MNGTQYPFNLPLSIPSQSFKNTCMSLFSGMPPTSPSSFWIQIHNSLCCISIDKPPMTFLPWGFFIVTLLQVGETSHLIYTSLEMMQKKPFGWFSNQYKSSNIQRYRQGKNRSKTLKLYSTRKKFLLFSVCIVLEQRITRKIEQNLCLPLNLPYPNHLYTYVKCIQL